MYKCEDCGHIFEEGEQCEWEEMHGFTYGPGEHFSGCPRCKGGYYEVYNCEDCGEIFEEDELHVGRCAECLKNNFKGDFKMCEKVAEHSSYTEDVAINGFLATQFTAEEINKILSEKLEEKSKNQEIDCSEFIAGDIDWFGEVLAEVLTEA